VIDSVSIKAVKGEKAQKVTIMTLEKHQVQVENAAQILQWLETRGGLAIWRSINLSNPGVSWACPLNDENGLPKGKPSWQADNQPERIITDIDEVEVVTALEVKRFHVGVRTGGNGLQLKVTDGGSRRIKAAVAKAAENRADKNAWHEFDYSTQEAVILVPGKVVPLRDWKPEA